MTKEEKIALEGLIFLSGANGITIGELISLLNADQMSIEAAIYDLNTRLKENDSAVQITQTAQTYKLVTKSEQAAYYQRYAEMEYNDKLSNSAMETLAIIAYNQPITRFDIEEKRGVMVSHNLKLLVDRELVKVAGKAHELGRPNLYATTSEFLDFLGINSLDELPSLNDFIYELNNLEEDSLFNDVDDFKQIRERLMHSENIIEKFEQSDFDEIDTIKVPQIHLHIDQPEEDNGSNTENNSPE